MYEVIVEQSRAEDVHEIQEVFYKSWLETYPNAEAGITREDVEERWKDRHSAERIEKRSKVHTHPDPNERFLVARSGGKIVGVCYVHKYDTHNMLQAIYVLPDETGKGIGTRLWEAARAFLDASKPTLVHVAPYNIRAINFYEKLGFKDSGKRFTEERFKMKSGVYLPQMEMMRLSAV